MGANPTFPINVLEPIVHINDNCLVLNSNWQATTFLKVSTCIATVMRDMGSFMDPETYMLLDMDEWMAQEVAETDDTRWIKTATGRILAPEVVVLKKYGARPPLKISFNRSNLWKRDENTCQYCGNALPSNRLQIEHVMPRSRGGATGWDNCVAACGPCNSRKADKTPREARMRLRKKPEAPDWKPGVRVPSGALPASWEPFLVKEGVA